jgi:predicted phosphoribosyltransferase
MSRTPFTDRADAGRRLAAALRGIPVHDPLVLAIPRGGIAVAAPIAEELNAELDVVLARKMRAPEQPELAIGAVAEGGQLHLDHRTAMMAMADAAYIERERRTQLGEIVRRARLFRGSRPRARLAGRTVIVVDDGLATGSTMIAALRSARAEGATQLIAAVPVASVDALMQIGPLCERVVCLLQPEVFWAVGQFYADFEQVTDAQVEAALRERGRRTAQPAASGRDQATDAPTAAPWSPPAAGGRGW